MKYSHIQLSVLYYIHIRYANIHVCYKQLVSDLEINISKHYVKNIGKGLN